MLGLEVCSELLRGAADGLGTVVRNAGGDLGIPIDVLIARLRRSTMGRGVRSGATTPYHCVTANPGTPDSAIVGTSGAALARSALETASAFSLPARTCGCAETMLHRPRWTRPLIRSGAVGSMPL